MKDSVLNLINIKPANLDNLGSVITKCTYFSFDTFLYALSSGKIYLNDMRVCLQSRRTHQFSYQPDNYKEILSAVSDISVVDDHSFVARNLNTVILYDTRNDRSCVSTYEVFKADAKSVQRVCNLELVYERMHCVYEDGRIVTGDFDGNFYVFGRDGERVSVKGEGVAKVIGCRENEIVVCGESICYYKVE
ncbi:Serine/threonine protein phosphatase 2A, regulatory subunit [Trachipleistophora hominis]|uniref:Serine/threonine protein phosphatase 2A, regulatory subunit n=1 Tax=Trachipleistophora hominis TaxID=72359 RepID=L7K0J2_TRAHO|nr:Serine/threonine protein phosphatase 2A, regulatory subunit [Trachipleistophora hominis]